MESDSVEIANDDGRAAMVFSTADREKTMRYFKKGIGKSKKVPPGLAGKKGLLSVFLKKCEPRERSRH